jgi:hypothetical protein
VERMCYNRLERLRKNKSTAKQEDSSMRKSSPGVVGTLNIRATLTTQGDQRRMTSHVGQTARYT